MRRSCRTSDGPAPSPMPQSASTFFLTAPTPWLLTMVSATTTKKWGDQAFSEIVSQWYRGHGRLGTYSVVMFDSLDVNGRKYNAGFVTDDSRVLEVSCTQTPVVTRPWGSNSEYPPTTASHLPQGIVLQFQFGDGSISQSTTLLRLLLFRYLASSEPLALSRVESKEGRSTKGG